MINSPKGYAPFKTPQLSQALQLEVALTGWVGLVREYSPTQPDIITITSDSDEESETSPKEVDQFRQKLEKLFGYISD